MNSVDDFLYRQEVVKPLVLDLLENGLVHVHNEHEPGKKPHNNFFMAKTKPGFSTLLIHTRQTHPLLRTTSAALQFYL